MDNPHRHLPIALLAAPEAHSAAHHPQLAAQRQLANLGYWSWDTGAEPDSTDEEEEEEEEEEDDPMVVAAADVTPVLASTQQALAFGSPMPTSTAASADSIPPPVPPPPRHKHAALFKKFDPERIVESSELSKDDLTVIHALLKVAETQTGGGLPKGVSGFVLPSELTFQPGGTKFLRLPSPRVNDANAARATNRRRAAYVETVVEEVDIGVNALAKAMKSPSLKDLMVAAATKAKVMPQLNMNLPQTEKLMEVLSLSWNKLRAFKTLMVRNNNLHSNAPPK